VRSSASSFTGSASSGSAVRAHCSAASVTMRAGALRVELVGHAAPGQHRLNARTPSSVAFSSTRSKRLS
jgi:hypothetical protein